MRAHSILVRRLEQEPGSPLLSDCRRRPRPPSFTSRPSRNGNSVYLSTCGWFMLRATLPWVPNHWSALREATKKEM
jgi:hypothetical protein